MIRIQRAGKSRGAELVIREDVPYFTFPSLSEEKWLIHGFSTRSGGVSTGSRASMNLQFRGDSREAVLENYRRFGNAAGFPWERTVLSAQTHTVNILRVTEEDAGKGVIREKDYTDIDGLITDSPNLPLMCFSADCAILFLADRRHRAVGLAHSGWRGTKNRMGFHALSAMRDAFGTAPEDVTAAIGPCICGDCYEVGPEVADAFMESFFGKAAERILKKGAGDRFLLDLWEANRIVLEEAGIPAGQISLPDVCTRCNPGILFSHRVTGPERGTLGAVLMIRPDAGLPLRG